MTSHNDITKCLKIPKAERLKIPKLAYILLFLLSNLHIFWAGIRLHNDITKCLKIPKAGLKIPKLAYILLGNFRLPGRSWGSSYYRPKVKISVTQHGFHILSYDWSRVGHLESKLPSFHCKFGGHGGDNERIFLNLFYVLSHILGFSVFIWFIYCRHGCCF